MRGIHETDCSKSLDHATACTCALRINYEAGVGAHSNPHVPKPCAARIANGVWCQRVNGHPGACDSTVAPTYGPLEARPELWRRHKGMSIECGKPIANGWCAFQQGHTGPCGK